MQIYFRFMQPEQIPQGQFYLIGFSTGEQLFETTFRRFFNEMLTILPCMFIIIGLFDVWIPKEKLERHIGKGSGIKSTDLIVLLAVIQRGSLYVAFPFA